MDNLTKFEETEFAYFKNKAITSNISESWHSKLQSQFTTKERTRMRIDYLITCLHDIQTDFLDEYNRAIEDEGGIFTLKNEAKDSAVKCILKHAAIKPKALLHQVKQSFNESHKDEKVDGADNLQEMAFAKSSIENNLVVMQPKIFV